MMGAPEWLGKAHYHLTIWGAWRRMAHGNVGRGYPSHSAGLGTGGGSADFEDMADEADCRSARACDTVIADLPTLYRSALESAYLMQGVLKHNRRSTAELLLDAQAAFWERARRIVD